MHGKIEDFGTGFYGIELLVSQKDIENLISSLKKLREGVGYHFHLRGDFENSSGIADVMFAMKGAEPDNLDLEV
jgi:hypothetical protein